MAHELTPAALFACVLINALLLAPLERLAGSLPLVHGALSAHRHLANLARRAASEARERRARPPRLQPTPSVVPRLNITGPLALGLAAMLLFVAAASGAAVTRLGDLAAIAGAQLFETSLTPVTLPRGGIAARVHVRDGASVRDGDRLVTLDSAALDRQIAALKAQAETAKRQLSLVRQDATGFAGAAQSAPAGRPVLASLEQRTSELEQEAQWLLSRIASAEAELAGSEVRAPVSGRVVALGVLGANAPIAPGAVLLQIATNDRPLLDRLLEPLVRGLPHRPRD